MFSTSLRYIVIISILLVFTIGVFVVYGWYTSNTSLVQIHSSFVPMQFNTALGFVLSAVCLFFLFQNYVFLSRVSSVIIGLLGFFTLMEYVFNQNLGIDEFFMEHYITTNTSHLGRMAPNTALCFLLFGIASFLATTKNKIRLSGILGSLLFALGISAFSGYITNVEMSYGWGKLTKMAIHTSFGFMLLSLGIGALNWELENKSSSEYKNHVWFSGYIFVLSLIVFFVDMSTPMQFNISIIYTIIMLLGWFLIDKNIFVLAFTCSVFLVFGFLFSEEINHKSFYLTSRFFSLISIWVVTLLVRNVKHKEEILRKTKKRELQKLKKHAYEIHLKNKELAQFTYIASHDLQEPLRTVKGFSELLTQQYYDQFDEEAKQYFTFINQATDRMSMLVKGLLDYSRIGKSRELSLINCNALVKSVLDDLHASITDSKAIVEVEKLPLLNAYEMDLRLLFQNLISNAIKFHAKEISPIIKIRAVKENNFWRFFIEDNGIGIDENDQSRIFSIFQRLHLQSEYKGTGIGLAHCQKVVEMHGGEIGVKSKLGFGSTFYFTIKILKNETEA